MKPTARLPILAQHVNRTMVVNQKTVPLRQLFTSHAFKRLLPKKIGGTIYPNDGWEIVEKYGEKKAPKAAAPTPPEAKRKTNGKVRAQKSAKSSAGNDKGKVGTNDGDSKNSGGQAVVKD